MICKRCLNQDKNLFVTIKGEALCRVCIHLMGKLSEEQETHDFVLTPLSLDFELTSLQQKISTFLCEHGLNEDILVEAVCGAGKTELVMELIHKALEKGLSVGWMVARRQVVLQLHYRLKKAFNSVKVLAVTSGYTSDLQADLIICTAHQLYRFPNRFDLLIVDEPDAYPYKGNKMLEGILEVSSKGTKIYLSATPNSKIMKSVTQHVTLDSRAHNRPLVIPKVFKSFKSICFIYLLYLLKQLQDKQVLIFVPTIELANKLSKGLRLKKITSQSEDKDRILTEFENSLFNHLICTTVLERGMTFEKVNVIVYQADHVVFDEASLIQISGRVGRSFKESEGDCWFITSSKNSSVNQCLMRLKNHNQRASGVLNPMIQ